MSVLRPRPAAAALNHVLRSAPLAMERLARHAGRTIGVDLGPLALAFTVQTTGEVTTAVTGASRDLTVRVSPFLVPRLAARDPAAFGEVEMQGDPELAKEVDYLLRNLTWDVEEDLSRAVGDIAAHRLVGGVRSLTGWGRDAAWRSAAGAAEYATEEAMLVASRVKIEDFNRGVAELDAALARLEARIGRLE